METKSTEKPVRALECLSLKALLRRAQDAKLDPSVWNDSSELYRMDQSQRFGPERPTQSEVEIAKRNVIAEIGTDPEVQQPISGWDTARVKEWIWDIEGVDLDDSVETALYETQIEGGDLLSMTKEDLKDDLGIGCLKHRLRKCIHPYRCFGHSGPSVLLSDRSFCRFGTACYSR